MPIKGVDQTVAHLAELDQRASNPAPALRRLVPSVRDVFRKVFATEGTYGGGPRWAPLALTTLFKKKRRSAYHPLLHYSGTLWRSLVEGGRWSRTYIDEQGLHVGSRDPVLHLLRGGTTHMSARDPEPAEIEDRDINAWASAVAKFVTEGK